MLKEEKEAIKDLEKFRTIKVLYGNTFAMHIEQLKQLQSNIDTVLNLIQKQQTQSEQFSKESEKKDKIIDKMVSYISSLDIDEDICSKNKERNCNNGFESEDVGEYCKQCIKQYFERKVENEYKSNS